jgi:hypothetical protein
MPAYLERYRNGECVQVWDELIALGDNLLAAVRSHRLQAISISSWMRLRGPLDPYLCQCVRGVRLWAASISLVITPVWNPSSGFEGQLVLT